MKNISEESQAQPEFSPELRRIIWNLQAFQFFNAISCAMALGAPMVMAARMMEARETYIGALLSFTPFLVLLQLLAVNTTERLGPRRLVLAGWSSRVWLIMLIAPLPLLEKALGNSMCLLLFALLLLGFNAIRGFTTVGWLPWVSRLLPEEHRAAYFGKELIFVHGGVLSAQLVAVWLLAGSVAAWKYSLLFAIAGVAGLLSLRHLKRLPEAYAEVSEPPHHQRRSAAELAAAVGQVWKNRPFRQLLLFTACNCLALTAFPGFLLVYLRDGLRFVDSAVLVVTIGPTIGVLATSQLWVRLIQRFGSRPGLRLGTCVQGLTLVVWAGITAGYMDQPGIGLATLIYFIFGAAAAGASVAFNRLLFARLPAEQITVATTVFSITTAVCQGMAPLFWGLALEHIGNGKAAATAGAFTLFFATSAGLALITQFMVTRIRERGAAPTRQVLLALCRGWPLRLTSDIGVIGGNTAARERG